MALAARLPYSVMVPRDTAGHSVATGHSGRSSCRNRHLAGIVSPDEAAKRHNCGHCVVRDRIGPQMYFSPFWARRSRML
ncbi:hypothetical protein C8N35_1011103 [Breoghania corrubedonensis]|uniref:Uncharacterized protein n=1 Tax=Breoghania corrubedonensis TaxID=665038 RepID=A0A2T5VH35_9HYPH|nr:hypothetical protein C8N35_1011103 [Breoghania corrubedonensis]